MKITKTLKVQDNLDQVQEKVERLADLLKEANSIIEELASMDLEVNIDV